MDKETIIAKYKGKAEKLFFTLEGNRLVIGEEVDSKNQLWYVIRDGENYTMELAFGQRITQNHFTPTVHSVTINLK